jgi:hypothetical protein
MTISTETPSRRLNDAAKAIQARRVEPFEDEFLALATTNWKAACAFGDASGRDAAIEEVNALDEQNDVLFRQMMSIPATTQPGRAAKVRALMVHALGDEWRGPSCDLDWEKEEARKLLGEFAGMTEDELAAI